ncbi:MAG TPA: hypothetical protein VEG08_08330 [Terriglobales bacterium]|nr:hypothetical protein [Terriglobales bacterium]
MGKTRKRSRKKELLGLAFDVVLAAVPAVAPIPAIARWIIWFACFVGFLVIVQLLIDPVNRVELKWRVVATGLLAVTFVAGLWPTAYSQWRQEMARQTWGKLVATEELPDVPPGHYQIQIGTVGAKFNFPSSKHDPWQIFGDTLTFGGDDNGDVLFSTVIRDRVTGNRIVEIDRNVWHVSNQQNVCWDKNYSRSVLEVLDGRGNVVLQVRLFKNGVQLQGEWHDDKGDGLRLVQYGPQGPQSAVYRFVVGQEDPALPDITRSFRYPSDEFWSEQTH